MIRVILRQCDKVNSKPRPAWFSHEGAFRSLLGTMDGGCQLTVLFDGDPTGHFVMGYAVDVVRFDAGSDAGSFRKVLGFARRHRQDWADGDVLYFAEDDYIHRQGWPQALREGLQAEPEAMVSVYDHPDKYLPGAGACHVSHTACCHWRTAMSTTNTFALRASTFFADIDVYERFADPAVNPVCVDHERYLTLWRLKRRRLLTSIPAFATHAEDGQLAPVIGWAGP